MIGSSSRGISPRSSPGSRGCPRGPAWTGRNPLRSTVSGLDNDEEEEGSLGARLAIALVVLSVVLWQVRVPAVRYACGHQWLGAETCTALLPSEAPPPAAPPAPTAPAP
ncbi:MAG: hypothetical protein QM757_36345 [Paludibaculum sp.]